MKGGTNSQVNACVSNATNEVNFGGGTAKLAEPFYQTQTGGGDVGAVETQAPAEFGNGWTATRQTQLCDAPHYPVQAAGRRRRRRRSRRRTRSSRRRSSRRRSTRRRSQSGGNKIPTVQRAAQPMWRDSPHINLPSGQAYGQVYIDGEVQSAAVAPFRQLSSPHPARTTGTIYASNEGNVFSNNFSGGKRRKRKSKRKSKSCRKSCCKSCCQRRLSSKTRRKSQRRRRRST